MTAEDLLNAYRDEMAPTLGRAFIEGFIARNRSSMLRMLAPLVALMNERMQAPRVSEVKYEDPDEVTPEKDAIVWAAFNQLVEEKRRQLNIQLDKPVSGKARKTRAQQSAAPVGVDPAGLKNAILTDSLSEPQRLALREIILKDPAAALRVAVFGGHEASIYNARSSSSSLNQLGLQIEPGDLRYAWMVAMQALDPMVAKTNAINQADDVPASVREQIGLDHYEQEAWRRLFRNATDTAIEQLYRGVRPSLEQDAAIWSRVVARATALAALNMKPSMEELLPAGQDELSSGIKKWMASDVTESLRSCRSCQPSARKIRDAERRGSNAVHDANIMDAGLTAAWRGMTESMPFSRTPIAITLRHPRRRDLVAMVTASASEPWRYQLTWADNDGPSGHTTRDTPEEAVRHAVDEGYRLDTANSTEAQEMVERVQQERERRAAEIESWLTESLPSRKTSSSQTAQQFIASFMRWKPHDRMYYELLELRPEATTQEIETKWGRSLKLTDILNPRRPMYRDSSVQRQAFDVLTNPGWRRDYDANGNLDASFQGLRQRALDATLTVASGDAMTDQDREVLLGVVEMGPEAYALHRNLRLPEVVAKTREILHEMDADDAKYRLPPRTESLPSPKHAGRMGDGFNVGEHVIRIGDMIKMEGQLGGYVASVDRSKGIARIEQDNGEIKTWPLASLLHDTAANRERQQEHNNQINAEAEARLEQSLADWRAR